MAQLIVLFLIIFFMRKVYDVIHSTHGFRNPHRPRKPRKVLFKSLSARGRFGVFAGAIALIAGAEYLAPTTRATGLVVKSTIEPDSFLDATRPDPTRRRYDDLAQSTPWLSSLGVADKDQAVAWLTADLDRARAMLGQAVVQREIDASPSSYEVRVANEVYYRLQIASDGFAAALDDLDSLFADGPVNAARLNQFVHEHLLSATDRILNSASKDNSLAARKLKDYTDQAADQEALIDDPIYQDLKTADAETFTRVRAIRTINWALSRTKTAVITDAAKLNPQAQVPNLSGPLAFYHVTKAAVMDDDVITGPAPNGGMRRFAVRLGDAVVGKRRAPTRQLSHQQCGLVFAEQSPQAPLVTRCEIAVPLAVNYDLTGTNCDGPDGVPTELLTSEGSLISPDGCKEAWIFPHLNIVFDTDRFTVYPPRPSGFAGDTAPLSQWVVTWNDDTKAIDQPASFAWDGRADVLGALSLSHVARPRARDVKIWDDFRLETTGVSVAQALKLEADDRNAFSAIVVGPPDLQGQDFVVPAAMRLGQSRVIEGAADTRQFRALDSEINSHLGMVSFLSFSPRQISAEGDVIVAPRSYCHDFSFVARQNSSIEFQKRLIKFADKSGGDPCEVYAYMSQILGLLQRSDNPSTFAWMMK